MPVSLKGKLPLTPLPTLPLKQLYDDDHEDEDDNDNEEDGDGDDCHMTTTFLSGL